MRLMPSLSSVATKQIRLGVRYCGQYSLGQSRLDIITSRGVTTHVADARKETCRVGDARGVAKPGQ
jgi:hypothetical protein